MNQMAFVNDLADHPTAPFQIAEKCLHFNVILVRMVSNDEKKND